MERVLPPDDIPPENFFRCWVPEAVAGDSQRRERLGDTEATIVFELTGEDGGVYTIEVASGSVVGRVGEAADPDLRVQLDVSTWRKLNRGELSAPEALLKRKLHIRGNFLLGLKLHLILG